MKIALAVVLVAGTARADGVSIGARLAPQWLFLEGDGTPADLTGDMLGVDVAVPITRRASIAVAAEGALYAQRSDRVPPGGDAHDLAAFAELQLDTRPGESVAARIALGAGVRWLSLPLAGGPTDRFFAWEPLRLRVGPVWRPSPRTEIGVMGGFGFGFIATRGRDGTCVVTGSCADSLYDSDTQSTAHFVVDLSLVARAWL